MEYALLNINKALSIINTKYYKHQQTIMHCAAYYALCLSDGLINKQSMLDPLLLTIPYYAAPYYLHNSRKVLTLILLKSLLYGIYASFTH